MVPTLWGSSLAFVVVVLMVGFTLYQVALIARTVLRDRRSHRVISTPPPAAAVAPRGDVAFQKH